MAFHHPKGGSLQGDSKVKIKFFLKKNFLSPSRRRSKSTQGNLEKRVQNNGGLAIFCGYSILFKPPTHLDEPDVSQEKSQENRFQLSFNVTHIWKSGIELLQASTPSPIHAQCLATPLQQLQIRWAGDFWVSGPTTSSFISTSAKIQKRSCPGLVDEVKMTGRAEVLGSRSMRDLYWSRDTDWSFPEQGSWQNVAINTKRL